jgi:succinate dehydrogenase / fumarate reductase, cytochrome b subunit
MRSIVAFMFSTIGRKQLTAIAGLGLCAFVLIHVSGNFLMFLGPEAYNKYGHGVISNPFIYVAEIGLLGIFVLHTIIGVWLTIQNFRSRPERYAVRASGEKGTPLVMRTMFWQGVVIFVFAILHLITFKYGPHYTVTYDGQEIRDLFRLLHEVFQSPGYVTWYVFAVLVLGYHLSHGLYSSIQTLGFNHPVYNSKLQLISIIFGAYIGVGFAVQPLYMMFFYKG